MKERIAFLQDELPNTDPEQRLGEVTALCR